MRLAATDTPDSSPCPEELIRLAHRLADAAGGIVAGHYRKLESYDSKADESPVTVADRETEKALRDLLAEHRPNDGVHGEEYGVTNKDSDYMWVIDPIDGTKPFITGRPLFGTLIALLHKNRPLLGIIDQPITKDRWTGAAGHGATLNGAPCETSAKTDLADALIATTSPEMFAGADMDAFARLRDAASFTLYGGDCYSYGQLAGGWLDIVIEADLKFHDFAALIAVVEGAGGIITDWQGNPLTPHGDGRVLASANQPLHDQALTLLRH